MPKIKMEYVYIHAHQIQSKNHTTRKLTGEKNHVSYVLCQELLSFNYICNFDLVYEFLALDHISVDGSFVHERNMSKIPVWLHIDIEKWDEDYGKERKKHSKAIRLGNLLLVVTNDTFVRPSNQRLYDAHFHSVHRTDCHLNSMPWHIVWVCVCVCGFFRCLISFISFQNQPNRQIGV